MEANLVEMWKLLPKLQSKPIQLPILSPKGTLLKNRATVELKTSLQRCLGKEPIAEVHKVVTPMSRVQMKLKMIERELETPKTTSSNPFPRTVSTRKTKKEPTPNLSTKTEEEGSSKDVEEVEMVNSNEELETEEEGAELETPPLEKTKLKTRTFERKKSTPAFKTLGSSKKPAKGKTPKKGESSQKKPKRK